jgi:hypothetical protein
METIVSSAIVTEVIYLFLITNNCKITRKCAGIKVLQVIPRSQSIGGLSNKAVMINVYGLEADQIPFRVYPIGGGTWAPTVSSIP